MRSSQTRHRDIKGEPQARYPPGPGRQDMESTVTLVRLANRLNSTTKALSVHSAARLSALSDQRTDRSCRRQCAAVSNSSGDESWKATDQLLVEGNAAVPEYAQRTTPATDDEHKRLRPTLPLLQPSRGKRLHRLRIQLQSPYLIKFLLTFPVLIIFLRAWALVLATSFIFSVTASSIVLSTASA